MATEEFDYIVVGGGSAGCVAAYRLVKAGRSVLLLEAGPKDDSMYVHMPATFVRVLGTERSWIYESEAQAAAGGRKMFVPQGRTLGGGSSVNAMVYIRGNPRDYDGWRDAGCIGWGWDEVLPVFRRAEANQRFADGHHGTEGVLPVNDPRYRHPLSLAFVRAAQEAGLAYNDDFNGVNQMGVGFYQSTTFNGERGSTAATYLAAVLDSALLTVRTGCHVARVIVENGNATGVDYLQGGQRVSVKARAEVVLAAGALATPKLLMLSGIGPGEHLRQHGIAVVRDAAEVGSNYQDHLEVSVYGRTREPISLLGQDQGLTALRHGLQYKLFRSGLLTSTVVESGGFVDLDGDGVPELQFHVLPTLVGDVDREPLAGHGISINPCFLRPKSRGTVQLRGNDPLAPILFDGGYLSAREDVDVLIAGVKLARRILRSPSLARIVAEELLPSAKEDLSDAAIEEHVRRYAKTVYHPTSTCRMGSDQGAVVDPQLRVRGVGRLRVCDASVMPKVVAGNTNAPSIMIGERCADFILAGR